MATKRKQAAKKPRTLNAVWADARCWWDDSGDLKIVDVAVDTNLGEGLTAKQALRLSQWLAEAAAWKAEE